MFRKYLVILFMLLCSAGAAFSQTNGVIALSVTGSPLNIVLTTPSDHVTVRENSSSPTISFIIQIGGNTQTATYAAGSTFTFVNQNGNIWPAGTVVGNITAVTGSGSFIGIQSIGIPSSQSLAAGGSLGGTVTLAGNGGVSNGQWVNTSDVLWTQYTSPGSTLYPGLGTAQILSSYRILKADGTITNGQWVTTTCNMSANGGYGIGIQVPVAGWLQSYTTYLTTGGVSQGTVYANLYVLPSMPSGGSQGTCSVSLAAANFGSLLAGAPTGSFYPVGFVGTTANIVSPWAIPAPAVNQSISNPSAGAEFQATLGTQTRTCVTGLSFALTTSATVANRTVSIRMIQPASTGTQLIYIASITQPASTTVVYSFSPGTLAQQQTFGASILQTVPFTNGAPVCFNGASTGTIGSLTANIQAADQYSSINLALTQLPDLD